MQMGVFTLQFYKDCLWHVVTVDSFLPCKVIPVDRAVGGGDGGGDGDASSSSV